MRIFVTTMSLPGRTLNGRLELHRCFRGFWWDLSGKWEFERGVPRRRCC